MSHPAGPYNFGVLSEDQAIGIAKNVKIDISGPLRMHAEDLKTYRAEHDAAGTYRLERVTIHEDLDIHSFDHYSPERLRVLSDLAEKVKVKANQDASI